MDIFERARIRSPFISSIIKFQRGYLYPFVFAVLCAVSASFGKDVYIPCIATLCILTAFAGLFSSDLIVFVAPAFMIYYSIGADKPSDYYENYYRADYHELFSDVRSVPTFDRGSRIYFVAWLCILFAILVYKLIHSGVLKEMLTERGVFFYSIMAIDAALILNGIGGGEWQVASALYGLLCAFVLTVCYCMFYVILKRTHRASTYACIALVATAFCVLLQVLITLVRLQHYDMLINHRFASYAMINRHLFSCAWGLVTIVAAVIACGIPASFFLARNNKAPVFFFLLSILFYGSAFLVATRSAMLFGGASFLVGIICSLRGKNKRKNLAMTLFLLLLGLLAVLSGAVLLSRLPEEQKKEVIGDLLRTFRVKFKLDGEVLKNLLGARYDIWARGIRDFLRAPVLGVGFVTADGELNRVYDHMYHNVAIEFIGAMGSVGGVAFLFHIFCIFRETVRKACASKLILMCVPLLILAMSLLDNFFFYPNFSIIYGAFLACAELYGKQSEKQIE